MNLVALPCPGELARPFLERAPGGPFDALVLEKQAAALTPALKAHGARTIHAIPEALYGRVTRPATRTTLRDLAAAGYERAFFPTNNFDGNVALLLACLTPDVTALSATAADPVRVSLADAATAVAPTPPTDGNALRAAQDEIVRRLSAPDERLAALDGAERAGERPTHGLVAGYPYDAEVLFRYGAAAERLARRSAGGRFLEVGAGLGYGSWTVARLVGAGSYRAFDYDEDAVALAAARFGDGPSFHVGRGEDLPTATGSADVALCFEVLEHLHEPAQLVREVFRLLAPGGWFVGSTPNHRRYPYRVHDGRAGTPTELRAAGFWPWHVTALDETAVATLLAAEGFTDVTFGYPTWATGLRALPRVLEARAADQVDEALDLVAGLDWSVADFALSERHIPVFSGFSFLFSARRRQSAQGGAG